MRIPREKGWLAEADARISAVRPALEELAWEQASSRERPVNH